MAVFITILIGVCAFVLGSATSFIFVKNFFKKGAIGTLMFEKDGDTHNIYFILDVEPEEAMKNSVAITKIGSWSSRK